MDDTEMGRPARHARGERHVRGDWLGDVMRKGADESVRVRGTARCSCGNSRKVDFSGPADSMGVSIARSQLANPLCDECIEREDRERAAVEAEQERAATIQRRLDVLGLPVSWRRVTLDRLERHAEQEQALALARAWAAGGGEGGLLLHGEVGVGKTVIAAAAAVERCAFGPVRWLGVAELLMDLRMPFDAPEYARAQRALDPGSRGVALVLDDLDKSKPSEHTLHPLYVAVNAWVEARQPLLVTLNRDLDKLAAWMGPTFGPPIASRLAGYCDVVEVCGPDRRLE